MAPQHRLWIRVGLVAAVAVAAAWIFLQFLRPEARVVTAFRGRAINAVPASVTVLAERSLVVKSEVGGRVVTSHLDLSAKVGAGGRLVELDTTDLDLEIAQLQSDYDATRRRIEIGSATSFELINEQERLATLEGLHRTGNVPLVDLERQRRAVKLIEQKLELESVANQQQLTRLETDLKFKRRQREKMFITSPVEGVIAAVHVTVGELIPEGAPVATIIADSRVVEAKIAEENFSGIRVGQKATVRFLGYSDTQYSARVDKILPSADPLTQRYVVHLGVEIDPKLLVPGITGDANIVVDARDNAVIIPRRALFGRNVFVVNRGRVELRTVEIGFTSLNQVEILKGVEEGEQVVVEGIDLLRDGDRVSVTVLKS